SPILSHAEKNTFATGRINQACIRTEPATMNYLQHIPDKCGDLWGSEKLTQFAPAFQICCRRFRCEWRLLKRSIWFEWRDVHLNVVKVAEREGMVNSLYAKRTP